MSKVCTTKVVTLDLYLEILSYDQTFVPIIIRKIILGLNMFLKTAPNQITPYLYLRTEGV